MSPKERIFVAVYISNGFNANQAYKTAHPQVIDTIARVEGCKTLTNPNIKAAVKAEVDHSISIMREASRKRIADIVDCNRGTVENP